MRSVPAVLCSLVKIKTFPFILLILAQLYILEPLSGQEIFMTHSGREVKGTVQDHNEFEVSLSYFSRTSYTRKVAKLFRNR